MRRVGGFTLIEMLIVIVIIGILASIAIPKFYRAKERSVIAKMRNDLRALAMAEEAYFNEHSTYYGGGLPAPGFMFTPSVGVVIALGGASQTGWAATSSSGATTATCALFHGTGGPIGPATEEGRVACETLPP